MAAQYYKDGYLVAIIMVYHQNHNNNIKDEANITCCLASKNNITKT